MKVAHLVGARPQFIKYAPVFRALQRSRQDSVSLMENILMHTGQHYDDAMSAIFFRQLGISAPDHHLGVGSASQGAQTARILQKAEEVLSRERPDVLVVYGDTNSTLGGALAAVKLHIPVAHVEAGLRSFNKDMPEEVNRVLTDHVSTVLFCPTEGAAGNLRTEGFTGIVRGGKCLGASLQLEPSYAPGPSHPLVVNVGDVMYDALLHAVEIASRSATVLRAQDIEGKAYHVLTLHRAENTDDPERMERIMAFVNERTRGTTVIFPVHPRTRKALAQVRNPLAGHVRMIEPLGYFDMVWLVKNSALVLTDSGGLQKEAYWLGVPAITLREETEWIETVQSGWNVLYGDDHGAHHPAPDSRTDYGDGRAAERILTALAEIFDRQRPAGIRARNSQGI